MRNQPFNYERRSQKLLPRRAFMARLFMHFLVTQVLVLVSLIAGMAGYAHFEGLGIRDAFLNSAMLLGGMGPVNNPHTNGGKVFAGIYALYCGLVVIVGAGVIMAPVVHRIIHQFHGIEEKS
jgi:hypothetical protein